MSAALCLSLSACGDSSSSSSSSDSSTSSNSSSSSTEKLGKLSGVTATGTPGKKLNVKIDKPLTIKTNSYAVLQKGNGTAVKSGQRVCLQAVVYNARTAEQLVSTWEDNTPDCSLTLDSTISSSYLKIFEGAAMNTTIAFGMPADTSSSSSSSSSSSDSTSSNDPYVYVETLVSATTDPTRAEGEAVTDIPSELPKVTLDKNGKPSLDMNGYKATKKLVAQTLIKGTGAKVTKTSNLRVHYTGWLTTGKQFDSSWTDGTPLDVSLASGVIKGWTQGLAGQTVGSQVLLIIPPSLGYGSTAQGSIPKNSTLVFVVDILASY